MYTHYSDICKVHRTPPSRILIAPYFLRWGRFRVKSPWLHQPQLHPAALACTAIRMVFTKMMIANVNWSVAVRTKNTGPSGNPLIFCWDSLGGCRGTVPPLDTMNFPWQLGKFSFTFPSWVTSLVKRNSYWPQMWNTLPRKSDWKLDRPNLGCTWCASLCVKRRDRVKFGSPIPSYVSNQIVAGETEREHVKIHKNTESARTAGQFWMPGVWFSSIAMLHTNYTYVTCIYVYIYICILLVSTKTKLLSLMHIVHSICIIYNSHFVHSIYIYVWFIVHMCICIYASIIGIGNMDRLQSTHICIDV